MTKSEILDKAIHKAIDNGWDILGWKNREWYKDYAFNKNDGDLYVLTTRSDLPIKLNTYEIIFNHDFAKALWGEEEWKLVEGEGWVQDKDEVYISGIADVQPAFRMHLQQMVIADDKIEYLGENI